MLTADAIRAVDDTVYDTVDVPEWGGDGKVRVRGLTAKEKDAYDRELVKFDPKTGQTSLGRLDNVRALLVVRCLVNEEGERIFRDGDAKMLGEKSSLVVQRIYEKCREISGMREEEVEEAAADLDGDQPDDSSSE